MKLCRQCYQAIWSRGEIFDGHWVYVDEDEPNESHCDWCEEDGFDELFITDDDPDYDKYDVKEEERYDEYDDEPYIKHDLPF